MGEANREEHSRSCVRAGLVLLLASAFGVSLLAALAKVVNFDAYGAYVSERLNLQNALEELDREPCFLDIATRPYADESRGWSIDQLSRYFCGPLNVQTIPAFASGREDAPSLTFRQPTGVDGSPPPALQDLRIWAPLRPAHGIYKALQGLRDQRSLDLARKVNFRVDLAVYRWESLWATLISARAQRENTTVMLSPDPRPPTAEELAKLFDFQMTILTLDDARRLAAFEPLALADFEQDTADVRSLALPGAGGEIRVSAISAAQVTILGMCVTLLWLWLNQRELAGNGGVFEMFSRTAASRTLLRALLWGPLCVMALLALRLHALEPFSWPDALYLGEVLLAAVTARAVVNAMDGGSQRQV